MHTLFSLPFMLPMLYTLKTMTLCARYSARPLRPSRIPSRAISNDPPPLAVNPPPTRRGHTPPLKPRPGLPAGREGRPGTRLVMPLPDVEALTQQSCYQGQTEGPTFRKMGGRRSQRSSSTWGMATILSEMGRST